MYNQVPCFGALHLHFSSTFNEFKANLASFVVPVVFRIPFNTHPGFDFAVVSCKTSQDRNKCDDPGKGEGRFSQSENLSGSLKPRRVGLAEFTYRATSSFSKFARCRCSCWPTSLLGYGACRSDTLYLKVTSVSLFILTGLFVCWWGHLKSRRRVASPRNIESLKLKIWGIVVNVLPRHAFFLKKKCMARAKHHHKAPKGIHHSPFYAFFCILPYMQIKTHYRSIMSVRSSISLSLRTFFFTNHRTDLDQIWKVF